MKGVAGVAGFCLASAVSAAPATYAATYATWLPWEADSVATAWVLKRHVAPEARFVALPKGADLEGAEGIDVPGSPYRRSGRRAAFDEALRLNGIDTPCTRQLQPMIRLLELAKWRKSSMPEAQAFEAGLVPLLPQSPGEEPTAAFDYIDRFCAAQGGAS